MTAIDDRYNALGGPASFLGAPISDEQRTGIGPSVHIRIYEHGAIYSFAPPSSGPGGHVPHGLGEQRTQEVHGAIWEHYQALGREDSFLGYPTSDEVGDSYETGRLNHFDGGIIYWSGPTGAHEVHGAILAKWRELGAERSYLGRPISDEDDYASEKLNLWGRRSRFEHGEIDWVHGEAIPWPNSYTFTVTHMKILNTRSRHEDTDAVVVSAAVGNTPAQNETKNLGDVNNGDYDIDLAVTVTVPDSETGVAFNYVIVNAGNASWDDTNKQLRQAGGKLAEAGATAATAAIGTAVGASLGSGVVPVIGTAIGAIAGWIAGELVDLLTADCDGPVAAEQARFNGQLLADNTTTGPHEFSTLHPGVPSPAGCGSNSVYWVDWTATRVPPPPPE